MSEPLSDAEILALWKAGVLVAPEWWRPEVVLTPESREESPVNVARLAMKVAIEERTARLVAEARIRAVEKLAAALAKSPNVWDTDVAGMILATLAAVTPIEAKESND